MASVRDDYHRLADYFLVVGLGEEPVPLDKHEASEHYLKRKYKGDVVDRFPLRDYDDAPLPPGVPLFCGPNGFALSKDPGMPSFHYFCATHGDGDRTYGSCLTFYEPASQETLNRLKQAELGRRASAAFSRHRRHRKRSRRRHSMAPLATSLPLSASSSMSVEAMRTEMTDTVDDELDVGAHNARGRSTTSLSDGPANNGSSKKPGASRSKSGGRAATPGSNGAGAGAGGGKLVRSRTDLKWQPRRMSVSSSGVSIGSAGSAGSQGVARMRTAYDDDEDDEDDEFGGSADLDEYGDLLPRSRSDMAVATAEDLAATLSSITDSLRASDDPFQSSRWHVPKCICVLSHHSFLHSFRQFLTTLWRHSLTASNVPLERLICNFMTEVATPPLGKLEVQYILDDQTIVFKQPPLNNPIAFTHFPSRTLFEFLCVENIELLLRCVLLERQVLLLSSQLSLLTIVAETAMSLLYPFEPRQVYIPLLPRALIDFLNAPMPFLIGTHVEWVSLDQLDEDVVVVNLDEDSIRCEHEPPPFPKRERSKLFAALEPLAPLYKTAEVRALPFQNQDAAFLCAPPPSEVDDALTEQQLEFREAEVQATFFRVFVSIFKNFREFLIFPSKEDPEPTSCFATERFLAVQPAGSRKFLADLLATQAWQSFVELRTFPGCEEDYDVLFFDESIIAKKNRSLFQKKRKTPFISDTKYEITKTAVAPQPNVTGLDSDKTYRYEEWPRLDPTLYTPPRVDVAADRPHHGLSRQDSRRRENTKQAAESVIFSVWFMLFAEVVSEPGRGGSLEQGFLVLNRMHAENVHPEEFVFRLLVDACSSCGVPGRGIEVLALMREFNAAPSNALYTALLQGFISNGDASVGYEALAELRKPQLTNTSFESLVNKFSFGRSFQKHRVTSVVMKSKLFEHTFPDKTIVTENECPECQLMVTDDDIRKGWAGDENTYTTKCPQCGEKFVARLQVLPISSRYEEAQEDVVNCEYLPPAVLKKEVEALVTRFDGAYLASPQFRLDKVTHFWNLAWHFTYYRLPLDFVLKEVVISSEEETEGEAEVGVQVGVDAVEEVRLEDDEPSVAVVVEDVDEDVVDMVARSVGEGDGGT